MTDIVKETQPYELLVRWDEHGRLSGAHYQTRTIYREGDVIVADRINDPIPVGLAGNDGFPLDAILTPDNLDAVTAVNVANAERDAAFVERDAALGLASLPNDALPALPIRN